MICFAFQLRYHVEAVHSFLYYRAMSIGPLIQAWRHTRNQSLESLSDVAGIPYALLEQIESEQIDPSAATIQSIAGALHIPPAWLFETPRSFEYLFTDSGEQETPDPSQVDPVTDRILTGSRMDRSLYVLLTVLVQAGDPKLLRAAEMSLRSLVKQSRQASVPWQQRPPGHFEPPSD
jgi:transcriptional regulator with XRE-family HTH domain